MIFEGLNSEISSSILLPIRLAIWKHKTLNFDIMITVYSHSFAVSHHSLLNPDPQLVVVSNRASGRTPSLLNVSMNMSPCLFDSLLPSLFISSGRCPNVGGCHPRARYMRRCLEVEISHSEPRRTWLTFM